MLKIQKQITILCHKLNDLSINAIESIVKLYRYDAKRQQGFSREQTIFILKYSSFLQMCGIITLSHVIVWYIGTLYLPGASFKWRFKVAGDTLGSLLCIYLKHMHKEHTDCFRHNWKKDECII